MRCFLIWEYSHRLCCAILFQGQGFVNIQYNDSKLTHSSTVWEGLIKRFFVGSHWMKSLKKRIWNFLPYSNSKILKYFKQQSILRHKQRSLRNEIMITVNRIFFKKWSSYVMLNKMCKTLRANLAKMFYIFSRVEQFL